MAVLCPFFFKVEPSRDYPDKIDEIFQLLCSNCVFWTQKKLNWTQEKFQVPFSTPVLALFSSFWVTNRALVRPNLQGWT